MPGRSAQCSCHGPTLAAFFIGTVRGWGRVLDALRDRLLNLDLGGDVHKGKRNLKASRKVLDIIKSDVF